MKRRQISTYIIALLTASSLLMLPATLQAQEKSKTSWSQKIRSAYRGTYVGVDVFGAVNHILGSDFNSSEVSIEADFNNKYFPALEIGYGKTDTTNDETDIHFKTASPYYRIGVGYNVFHKKTHLPGQFIIGARYGFSSFSYDVDAPALTDPVWGETTIPFNYQGVKTNAGWLELVANLKTHVYKGFHLGLAVRYRKLSNVKKSENSEPWYIPGYGKNQSTNIGITYSLIYKLPF